MSKNDEKNKKNFRDIEKNRPAFFSRLEDACKGLFYISEIDAPVEAFASKTDSLVGGDIVQQIAGKTDETIEEADFTKFFERLTAVKDWHGEQEKTRAKKFLDLQKLIEENLSNRKVFRLGDIRIRIYAVGLDSEGRLVGIKTNAVET